MDSSYNQPYDVTSELYYSVSGAGDINNDGNDDVIIGYPFYSSNIGITYVIFGSKTPSSITLESLVPSQGFSIVGAPTGSSSGWSVSDAGDINNDGYDDIIIGAPNANSNTGISYVIFGKEIFPTQINLDNIGEYGFAIYGVSPGDKSGWSVSGAGDINNDGFDDIIIGAPGANSNAGKSYLIFGNSTKYLANDIMLNDLSFSQGFFISGASSDDNSGWSVSRAGDINHDKYSDIIIGAPSANYAAGVSYVLFGKNSFTKNIPLLSLSSTDGFSIIGANNNDGSGKSVGDAGDINNDGYEDIIIGAPGANSNAGTSYIIFGFYTDYNVASINLATLSEIQGTYINGASNNDESGTSVSKAGDVNGDGFDDVIIGAPSSDSNDGSSYIVFGAEASAVIQGYTPIPTAMPVAMPTAPTPPSNSLTDTAAFQITLGILPSLLGFIGLAVLGFYREKIAFRILNKWGHTYKLIYQGSKADLKDNEIGLRLDSNSLVAVVKNKAYPIVTDVRGEYNGISVELRNLIVQELEHSTNLKAFELNQLEKNQIRNFLMKAQHIYPTKTFCCLSGYKEVGYFYGTVYKLTLSQYKDVHFEKYKKECRIIDESIEMTSTTTVGELTDNRMHTSNPMFKSGHDIETASSTPIVYSIHSIEYNNPLLNHPQSSEIFKYAREVGGRKAVNTLLEYQGYISNDVNEIKDTIRELFADTAADNQLAVTPTKPAPTADNIHSSVSNNNLMISLLTAQQMVESMPIINYIAQGFNLSLPEVLDNKPMLITSHLVLGNAAAALLPYDSITNCMITSTIATSSYAMRLLSAGYLADQKQEVLAQDKPMSSFETFKYCGASMLVYTLPNLAKCAVTKWFIPEAECSFTGYDLGVSVSLAGADCYAVYKATKEPSTPTTADLVVPYIADSIAFAITAQYVSIDMSSVAMAMQSVKQAMAVVASVVAVDYVGRIVMDMVPSEVKEMYMEPVMDYVGEGIENAFINYT